MPPKKTKNNPIVTPPTAERSAIMRAVKGKDTKPEKVVRSVLHGMGFRFRLHKKELPGKPDIFIKRLNLAIFVHGCFWHRHAGCKRATVPKINKEFWDEKFSRNRKRDRQNINALKKSGIRTLVIWECEIVKGREPIESKIRRAIALIS